MDTPDISTYISASTSAKYGVLQIGTNRDNSIYPNEIKVLGLFIVLQMGTNGYKWIRILRARRWFGEVCARAKDMS
jgi:hypothetical protein